MTDFATEVLPAPTVVEIAPTSNGVEVLPAGAQPVWKNLGYYVAGATWEAWETTGAPSTSAPSGHSLVGISSIRES